MNHSKIVGGSTAKRVINCPGSVALVQQMPPQVESKYAAEGTLLHACMEDLLGASTLPEVAAKHNLSDEQIEKLAFCVQRLKRLILISRWSSRKRCRSSLKASKVLRASSVTSI